MKRIENWPKYLAQYFALMRNVPFEFRKNDCGQFACGAIKAITGVDLTKELGEYSTPEEEAAALRAIARRNEFKEIPLKMAQRGDIVLFTGENGPTVLVVEGVNAVGPGTNGMMFVPVLKCIGAWKIG